MPREIVVSLVPQGTKVPNVPWRGRWRLGRTLPCMANVPDVGAALHLGRQLWSKAWYARKFLT